MAAVSDGLWALYGKGQTPDILRRCEGQPGSDRCRRVREALGLEVGA